MAEPAPRFVWRSLVQVAGLSAASLLLFGGLYALDVSGTIRQRAAYYFDFEAAVVTDATSSLAGLIAALFGIVITVVSIIVQLSASRFAGVTRSFFADRVNLAVMTYYIVVCGFGVWLSPALHKDHVPGIALTAMLVLSTLGIALMVPYFGYVFWFLEPMNIVSRIQRRAFGVAVHGAADSRDEQRFAKQAALLSCLEELTDICTNSISGKDKIIASSAVDALKDFALAYATQKHEATPQWHQIGPLIRSNPDFVAMDPESLRELEAHHTWVEWKVLRQCLGIYGEALVHMRDINYLIAIDTRYIAEGAIAAQDWELLRLVQRYMNSYLRATINAKDVRTAYNVLNQYRLLVEATLRAGKTQLALEGVGYMKYYGHVSFDVQLTFITETVAYDVSTLCEVACGLGSEQEELLLEEFLDLDRPLLNHGQERGLLGVRKAQVKLACYYLAIGHEDKAQRIADDMREEPPERLQAIRHQLATVHNKDFWEITDRGRNFEFMPSEQREQLSRFFVELLGLDAAAPRASFRARTSLA
jgi:hypothetical protein